MARVISAVVVVRMTFISVRNFWKYEAQKGIFMMNLNLLYLGMIGEPQGARGRKRSISTSSVTTSEDTGSIRFCGFATFTENVTNITIVVTVGTVPGTAEGKSYYINC